ncbi:MULTISPECIES: hypothetical protein [unclassified Nostoc]|nr:hypothetical protein [Nostoc sp. JL34]MBN3883933.1 hypothetical protein [Nostoc sp. JL34]
MDEETKEMGELFFPVPSSQFQVPSLQSPILSLTNGLLAFYQFVALTT